MLVQYKNLTARVVSGPGSGALETLGATVIVATTAGVSVNGLPLRRFVPRLLAAQQTFIVECGEKAIALVFFVPPISSFEVGGVRFEA